MCCLLHIIIPYHVLCVEQGDLSLIPKADSVVFISLLKRQIANAQIFVCKIYFKNMLCCHLLFASGKILISQKPGDVIKSYTWKTT